MDVYDEGILEKIVWVPYESGGRQTTPSKGMYHSVAKFPQDTDWPNNAWSVVFNIKNHISAEDLRKSFGTVRFLVENAPHDRFCINEQFEIYEGPKKIANIFIQRSVEVP